jgi:putative Ca2+/H+ antiporter (TMEM165/GDT1 family)
MEAFLVSAGTIATAEMGDRTQLLALLLAARFRRPWPIAAGILVATLANHAAAGLIGVWFGRLLTPTLLNTIVGVSLLVMAIWTLIPDKLGEEKHAASGRRGVFLTTLICFFAAEIGDKTQIATLALAAAYANLFTVIAGTTLGMLIANVPAVFLGHVFAGRLPMAAIHRASAVIFALLGIVFLIRAAGG